MKRTITDLDLNNKTVILRVDFNTPLKKNDSGEYVVADNSRIQAALKTIKYILNHDCKLILLSHLSRIKTKEDLAKKSLLPVYNELKKFIKNKIIFCPQTRGQEVDKRLKELKNNEILMLENTRFEDLEGKKESSNDQQLAKDWAKMGDVFINDAFGTCHRSHTSNVGIANNIKENAIGFLIENELSHLEKLFEAKKPYVAIIGGAKISDKISVLEKLLQTTDNLIIGGAMAYTFLKSQGKEIGQSLVEDDYLDLAKNLLAKYSSKIILPIDNAISKVFENSTPEYADEIPAGCMGMDIGPKTIELFSSIIKNAKTVFWNGPLGVTEFDNYSIGTKKIALAIAQNNQCYSVVGGGDSAAAIKKLHFEDQFSFISTGGGASLEFVEGKKLPGLEAINNK